MVKASFRNISLAVLSTIGWLAIILQFYLLITNRKLSIASTVVQFFSYFTILTNILVAIYSSISLLASPPKKFNWWFTSPCSATALTVYIVIVGLVYNIILRFLWSPTGLQKLVDEALHLIIPLLFLIYWFLFVPKGNLRWKNVLPWLLYPIIYLVYVLIRGSITGLFPYPFLEISTIGIGKVVTNILVLCIVFFVMSLLFVGIGKLVSLKKRQ
jgi:hypothetical protein